jgi:hypothetical protein
MNKRIEIYEENGFIGIINNDLYYSFVDGDWELDQLFIHFIKEMNQNKCLIFNIGTQNLITFEKRNSPSQNSAFREIQADICVTNNKLYISSYTDLTMAAQFDDEMIPSKTNQLIFFDVDNGDYKIIVRQMFDPENYDYNNMPDPCFEIIINNCEKSSLNKFNKVIWWNEE